MATAQSAAGAIQSVSALQGTQREYEAVLILRPEINKAQISELIRKMQGVLTDRGATLIKIDGWGMRVLAYPIKRCRKGIYLYWRYLGGSDVVSEFERHLRINETVLRYYTVRVDDDVNPEARPSEVTDEILEAVSDPGPDPDEVRAAAEAARRAAEEAAAAERAAEAEAAAAAAAAAAQAADEGGASESAEGGE